MNLSKIFHTTNMLGISGSAKPPQPEMAPVVAVTGVLAGPETGPAYELVASVSKSTVPAKDRVIYLANRGRGPVEDTVGALLENLAKINERLEGKQILGVGHSLGAYILTEAVLKDPAVFGGVILGAGAQKGKRLSTPATGFIRHAAGNPSYASDVNHNSPAMKKHDEEVATSWPGHVGVDIAIPTFDEVFLTPHGLNMKLPEGQNAKKWIIGWPGTALALRSLFPSVGNEVRTLRSPLMAMHCDMILNPAFLALVRRRSIALGNRPQLSSEQMGSPASAAISSTLENPLAA